MCTYVCVCAVSFETVIVLRSARYCMTKDRLTDSKTDRQTDRQSGRQAGRQANRYFIKVSPEILHKYINILNKTYRDSSLLSYERLKQKKLLQ